MAFTILVGIIARLASQTALNATTRQELAQNVFQLLRWV